MCTYGGSRGAIWHPVFGRVVNVGASSWRLHAPLGNFLGGYDPSHWPNSNFDVLIIISYNSFYYTCYIHCSSIFHWWSCAHWSVWISTFLFMMYVSLYSHLDYFSIPTLSWEILTWIVQKISNFVVGTFRHPQYGWYYMSDQFIGIERRLGRT